MLASQPLRQVLSKLELSGRMLKWAIKLIAFNIKYRPHLAIKAQMLANFISEKVEFQEPSKQNQRPWALAVDGSST